MISLRTLLVEPAALAFLTRGSSLGGRCGQGSAARDGQGPPTSLLGPVGAERRLPHRAAGVHRPAVPGGMKRCWRRLRRTCRLDLDKVGNALLPQTSCGTGADRQQRHALMTRRLSQTGAVRTSARSSRSAAATGSSIPSFRPNRMAFSRMRAAISQIFRSAPGPNLFRKERAAA